MQQDIALPGVTKEILNKYKIRLTKKLGQNFLVDKHIIEKIIEAADIAGSEVIIEIGPGIGSLTQLILKKIDQGKLIAIEKDKKLVQVLHKILATDSLEIINKDVLEIDWVGFFAEKNLENRQVKLMANLPYYITTPIIMGLLEARVPIERYVFMVQKEVAERMVASPGGKDYGALSIAVQYYSSPEIVHIVPASVFIPRPAVDSAIIKLERYKRPPVQVENENFFFQIVKAIFQQRRKTLKNSLSKAANINLTKELIIECLEKMKLDEKIRGEKLDVEQIGQLSNLLARGRLK